MMRPQLYTQNVFRLTSLEVDTSLRDISRHAEKLEMMAKLGVASQDRGAFAIASVTIEEIRAAIQSIRTPEQRLLHEFFWFWRARATSKTDEALTAIKKGDVQRAVEAWTATGVDSGLDCHCRPFTTASARILTGSRSSEESRVGARRRHLHSQSCCSLSPSCDQSRGPCRWTGKT